MPAIDLNCNTGGGNVTLQMKFSDPSLVHTNGTGLAQDSAGALKFTIAVVLVYGVGVIGLLGISARRNRARILMDREVHKYLKRQVSRNGNDYSKPAKTQRTINKLITSLHFGVRSKNSLKNSPSGKSMTSPDYLKVHTTIRKSHTWSGEFVILPTLHEQEVSNYSSSEESYKETYTNILDKEDEESGSASKSLELDLCGSVESISSVSDDYEDCRDVFQSQKEMNFTSMM